MRPGRALLALLPTLALAACGEEFRAEGRGASGGESAAAGAGGSTAGGAGGSATGGSGGAAPACRGLSFDGVDDLVSVPDQVTLDGLAPLTVEAWVYPESYPGEVQIVSHHDHGAHTGYVLLIFSGSEMQFRYQFDGQNHPSGFTPVVAQQWHHVAATYDSGTVRLFVDGQMKHEGTIAQGVADDCDAPLAIGRAAYEDSFHFHGIIDEVRISRVARYEESFVPAKAPFAPDADTVALYHFDEDGGQVAADATGAHDGSLGATNQAAADDPERVDVPCLSELTLGGG